jgi:hypothetical protein
MENLTILAYYFSYKVIAPKLNNMFRTRIKYKKQQSKIKNKQK